MSKALIIYHANCFDGFTAAWVVWNYYKGFNKTEHLEFFPASYGQAPPDVKGRDVTIIDFSYKREVMEAMIKDCRNMLVLDHHKTAKEDLDGLEAGATIAGKLVRIIFDMARSGAGMAWDYFNVGPRPNLVNYVEDRDLWRFALPDSRAVHACVSSYPMSFDMWDTLNNMSLATMVQIGMHIERKHLQDIESLRDVVTRPMVIGGHRVPVANVPMTMCSDMGNRLAQIPGTVFGATYMDTPRGRQFSLRSIGEFDVATIAEQYGGGGHKNASGFLVSMDKLAELGFL